ncbi:UDP-N-acetyl-alpha-D-glucosamine C6 dehydratase [Polaromonas vacuolata]|uniref:UDP-N-acetyl-alpha-D-glucosamine C6 dehydratase n=1 Tax=Polaromonas vacuolata TaxID=37448 RepID=A0A6H2H740_9BURK|nr:nucleoside-diphosphate sugar epimerase/dehydratase [Polaromonas vacuolata]QJC55650.1 UDP-N-acetyl-alpha-D-glucosamine C6 dehydratase [Polaromonas vacuolata]
MQLRKSLMPFWLVDFLLLSISWWLAFWLRFNFSIPDEFNPLVWLSMPLMLGAYLLGLVLARVYRQVWRYIGLPELRQLGLGVFLGGLLCVAAVLMMRYPQFPRSVLLIHPMLVVLSLGAARAGWRTFAEHTELSPNSQPLLIIGSLEDATSALRVLKGSSQWHCVGIASPLMKEQGAYLQQIPVLGLASEIAEIARSTGATTVLLASPPGSTQRRDALLQANPAGLTLLAMPRADAWLRADGASLHKIELEDLLGREAVQLDMRGLAELFSGQTVCVSGAGGSIGSELCRQIARLGVARLVCIDASEIAVYKLEQELSQAHPHMQGIYYTANVREPERLLAVVQSHQPTVFFHAAAYKHVPLMESNNEIEAVRTNILGTLNAARVAGLCGAKKFVLISTDKAVNPTNIMGATKRMAELVVQSVAREFAATDFVSVRFGNVLGSSGSVVPLFTEQIAKGGPITVTHPDIVRYFMTIPEAARLVLQAGLMGKSGQIYVLDMGEPMKIAELARLMIKLSGRSENEIALVFTGLRPGEKLYEELLADDETTEPTPHAKLRIAKSNGLQAVQIEGVVAWVNDAGAAPSSADIRQWLRSHVPEYQARL